ncbi:hypothetical protein [Kitasatospora aureofaciens]|uniref:hypothetical protein n=1 Tax=Kitasatospora aureofaciens TaxID=1894 RepID=UPI001C4699DF|nr:hypothetical protein [Kitasatospora aureofaciens]MBV6703466.1 hypothetical protein [Kitasatospora aureofaciens]
MSDNSDRKEGALKRKLLWWTSILAGIATIATLIIVLQDRPKPFTIQNWARHANAACDQDSKDLSTANRALDRDSRTVESKRQSGIVPQADLDKLANDLADASSAELKLTGDLLVITEPNSRKSDVQDVTDTLRLQGAAWHQASNDLGGIDTANPTSVNIALLRMVEELRTAGPLYDRYLRQMKSLGVDHCSS